MKSFADFFRNDTRDQGPVRLYINSEFGENRFQLGTEAFIERKHFIGQQFLADQGRIKLGSSQKANKGIYNHVADALFYLFIAAFAEAGSDKTVMTESVNRINGTADHEINISDGTDSIRFTARTVLHHDLRCSPFYAVNAIRCQTYDFDPFTGFSVEQRFLFLGIL